ncbi:MAG: diaminopimelate decarboxylase [Armatimonadetes bacterium]|nr:diaminopimelate decarboxylase [Armatimonadota bacterium]
MSATVATDRLILSDEQAHRLSEQFGTPLYVLDESLLRARAREFVSAWPGEVSFATKANSTLAVVKIAYSEGCTVDVASEGELRAALKAGVPASACRLHGNNKSVSEIKFAVESGVGKIIADAFEELERLAAFPRLPDVLLRIAPGVDPKTNAKISTGQADTKFGFGLDQAEQALVRALELKLPVIGFHCHVGSQLMDAESQVNGAKTLASLAVDMKERHGWSASFLNVGGGLGVRYSEGDRPMPVNEFCRSIATAVQETVQGRLDLNLGMEPGRAMVAGAGVTLYEVGVVKRASTGRKYVAVDGGLSDNPRPAFYGSKYELVWHSRESTGSETVTVSGKHCETDTLFPDVQAPAGVEAGDMLQVLGTGAYNSVMASNYNRLPRPAAVLLRTDGSAVVVQERETFEQVLQRERLPEGL